jgi:CheY-like chemotaxis protein/HPt (histidine-containing phosphotransfer) domain-containing protein
MRDKDKKALFSASLLLAEDDPLNADIAARTLQKMGCRVRVASDGLSVARLFEEGSFDLILMDCEMPEMDGFGATRQIRQLEAGRRHIPIVALTAHAPAEVREKCLAAGMDDVLAKPFKEAQLIQTLHRWIDGVGNTNVVREPSAAIAPVRAAELSVDRVALENVSAFKGRDGALLLKNVVARFADTARTQLLLLREKQAEGEAQEVLRIAHTLKSSSATLGAHCVSKCCAEIEARAGRGELAPLPGFLATLEKELSAAVKMLGEIVGEREGLSHVSP